MKSILSHIPVIALANEAPILPADLLVPGSISLANEARLATSTYSEALTSFISGWKDRENIKATLDFIAPEVPVGRRFEFKKAENTEAFLSEVDDVRSIGGAFKRVEYKGSSVNEKTLNKGLTYRLDVDEEGGAVTEEVITARLTERLYRNELRRAITALLAVCHNTGATWLSGSPNPDEDIRTAVAAAQLSSGVFPNRVLFGLGAWNARATAMSSQATAGAFAGLSRSVQEVAGLLGLESGLISRELYQSSGTAKSRIMGSIVAVFYAQQGVSKDDPTNVKRFVSNGALRVLRQEVGAKFVDITVEHFSNIVATATVGAEKLTIS